MKRNQRHFRMREYSGSGIGKINGFDVVKIDYVDTIIYSEHSNFIRGAFLDCDMTTRDCYIAHDDSYSTFAHGDTIKEAMDALESKMTMCSSYTEKANRFKIEFPEYDRKYSAVDFFRWHNIITLSCLAGRQYFCRNKGIDINEDSFTVREFIELTKNEYNGNMILELKRLYEDGFREGDGG